MRHFDNQVFLGTGRFSEAKCELLRELLDKALSDLSAIQQGAPEDIYPEVEAAALDIATALTGRKVVVGCRIPRNRRDKTQYQYCMASTKQIVTGDSQFGDLCGEPVQVSAIWDGKNEHPISTASWRRRKETRTHGMAFNERPMPVNIIKPCVICSQETAWACADCTIHTGEAVHVCNKTVCRDKHEETCSHVTL